MNVNEAIQSALENYQAGNLQQAENAFKKILEIQANNITAINLLGIIHYQNKNYDSSIQYMKKSIKLNPNNAQAYYILGHSMQEKGHLDEAITYYQKTLQLNPDFADVYYNLGTLFQDKKRYDEAISCYQKALQFNPTHIDAIYNTGLSLQEKGQLDAAIGCYRKALQLNANFDEAYSRIGLALQEKGQYDEAISCFQKALQLNPANIVAYYGLAVTLRDKAQFQESINVYRKSLHLIPDNAYVYHNIGLALMEQGKLDEAENYYNHALQLKPDELNPYQNLLMMMNYNSNYDAKRIFAEHVQVARHFAEPLCSTTYAYSNTCVPTRRLKVGYVSPDFRRHAVAYFIEPVIMAHNREYFDVFCYSNSVRHDEVTKRIKENADHWRNIAGMSDKDVTELIQKDRIDILVDLAGHTAGNRILVFARKPAPIQISWIGYLATTGLSTMDYKIVDDYTDPLGKTEQFYTERLQRLHESFLCYLPDRASPEVGPLPALLTKHITFGSFNNFSKVTSEISTLWASILNELPDSRLILKGRSFHDKTTCYYAINMFAQKGIATERIILQPSDPAPKHLESYNLVDIGLDTFPFNGAATTCDALWMGVPVITLAGTAYHSRVGVSLLSNVGLPELVAKTYDEYVELAISLASDIDNLRILRESLRYRMAHSPLTDAKRFTINLERSYREIWKIWCQSD